VTKQKTFEDSGIANSNDQEQWHCWGK